MISRYFFITPINFATVAKQAVLTDHLLLWSEGKRSVCGGGCGQKWDRVVIPEEVPKEGFTVDSTYPETEESSQMYNPGSGVPPVGDYQIPGAGGRGDVNHKVLSAKTKKRRFHPSEKGVTGNETLRSPIKKTYEGEVFTQRRFSYNPQVPQKEEF